MTGVWERNVTGQGVTVVVVDDGVEHTIQDIAPNYVSGPGTTPPYLLLDIPSGLSFFLEVTMPNRRAWRWDGIHLLFPSRHSRLAIKTWGVAPASARRGSSDTSWFLSQLPAPGRKEWPLKATSLSIQVLSTFLSL